MQAILVVLFTSCEPCLFPREVDAIVIVSRQNKPITGCFLIAKGALKTSLLMLLGSGLARLSIPLTSAFTKRIL